jgi:HEAT repeat protein
MTRLPAIAVLAATLALASATLLLAQAKPMKGGDNPFEPGAMEDPMKPAAPGPKKPGDKPDADAPPPPDTPAVIAIRDSNPTTPIELLKAADAMLNLGRPDESKKMLAKLIAAKPDITTLALAQRNVGPAMLFRFVREKSLQPEGQEAGLMVLDAASAYARDAGRVAAMVKGLISGDEDVRNMAYGGIRDAGDAAVAPLVTALAQPLDAQAAARLRMALASLGDVALEPLIAVLASRKDELRTQVALTLGEFKSRRAIAYLAYPSIDPNASPLLRKAAGWALTEIIGGAPTKPEVAHYLRTQLDALMAGKLPIGGDQDGLVQLYVWDDAKQTLTPVRVPATDASMLVAAQLAADLYDLDPKNPDYRRLRLLTMLEAAKLTSGMDHPLDRGPGSPVEAASKFGREALEQALTEAMRTKRFGAAAAACEVLGELGDVKTLYSAGASLSPLAIALTNRNPRLRFAAADAILKLDPQAAYPGSSYFAETLGYLATTVGARRAVVAHPQPTEAQSLVGMLSTMGYEAEPVYRGGQAVITAASTPDIELVILSDVIDGPRLTELIQQIRQDYRTAALPVALIGREETLPMLRQIAERDVASIAFPRPQDSESMAFLVRNLIARTSRTAISHEERVLQGRLALEGLAKLAAAPDKYRFYDLQRQETALQRAVRSPDVAAEAALVLGMLATPTAQRTLVDLASQHALPLPIREAAAKAFATAVKRKRVLLTTDEIAEQYARYNRTQRLDEGTQQVLASILDSIETPSRLQAARDQ